MHKMPIFSNRCLSSQHREPEKAKAIPGVPDDLHFGAVISLGYPLPSREQPHVPKPKGGASRSMSYFWGGWMDG